MWMYDPHIDPALQFDIGRAQIETLIDNALASGDETVMRQALEQLVLLIDDVEGVVNELMVGTCGTPTYNTATGN